MMSGSNQNSSYRSYHERDNNGYVNHQTPSFRNSQQYCHNESSFSGTRTSTADGIANWQTPNNKRRIEIYEDQRGYMSRGGRSTEDRQRKNSLARNSNRNSDAKLPFHSTRKSVSSKKFPTHSSASKYISSPHNSSQDLYHRYHDDRVAYSSTTKKSRLSSRSRSFSDRTRSKSSSSSGDKDDSVGHIEVTKGDLISDRYTIRHELGMGTFGKVFLCDDMKYNDTVALKVVRSIPKYIDSAKIEADILSKVYDKQKKVGSNWCMKMFSHFHYQDFYCMVCEPLGISLYELVKKNDYIGFPLDQVAIMMKQLLSSMSFLKSIDLIHTDLKLENILLTHNKLHEVKVLRNREEKSISVPDIVQLKLIDFGGATFDNDSHKSTIVNTRQYRGPEVTLEIGWSYPSDIWSVGCIVAELYSGELLFPTHDNLEHMAMMERCLGQHFSSRMIENSPVKKDYFHRDGKLRDDELSNHSSKYVREIKRIQDYFTMSPGDRESGIGDVMAGILHLDPKRRLTADEALNSPFMKATQIQ